MFACVQAAMQRFGSQVTDEHVWEMIDEADLDGDSRIRCARNLFKLRSLFKIISLKFSHQLRGICAYHGRQIERFCHQDGVDKAAAKRACPARHLSLSALCP
jgi:hypothetical protein